MIKSLIKQHFTLSTVVMLNVPFAETSYRSKIN